MSVSQIGLILLVACIVAMLSRRLKLPYSVGLVAAGIGLAFLGEPIHSGQTVVVQGTGSLSLFVLQLAHRIGAEAIATTTSADKAARAKALGAAHVINRAERPDWGAAVLEITDGRGADQIVEVAGGDNLNHSVQAVAPGGRIWLAGVLEGFEARFASVPAIHTFATIQAVFVGHRKGLENLVRAIDVNRLDPVIDTEFEFSAFHGALARLKQGPFGKVVVRLD
ncbi:zinc-binding dehydrogenase [Mesorhizobium sp. M0220]|uniref:zinc-binding dehydrogenase n=1 Tax=Mesorhizobium sp. M0220 TaxID=2956920 RepID=UPI003334FADE